MAQVLEEPPDTVSFSEELTALLNRDELEKGVEKAEEVIDNIRARLGSDDDLEGQLARALEAYGDFLRSTDQMERAELCYQEALHFLRRNEGFEMERGRIHSSLAVFYEAIGDIEQSKQHYLRSFDLYSGLKEDYPEVCDISNNLGYIAEAEDDMEGAEDYFVKAMELSEKLYGIDAIEVALPCNNLGTHYFKRENFALAFDYHTRALNLRIDHLGNDHPETADSFHNMALVSICLGYLDDGLRYFESSLNIYEKHLAENAEDYETVSENYCDVLDSLGETGKINDVRNRVQEQLRLVE